MTGTPEPTPDPNAAAKGEICRRLMEGDSLRSICSADDMPSKSTVCLWLAKDDDFRARYAAAREIQADALADEILDISDDGRNDWMQRMRQDGTSEEAFNNEHVQRSKLRVDSRKWLAGKLAPKKYGEATLLKHADADGGVLEVSMLLEQARKRAREK